MIGPLYISQGFLVRKANKKYVNSRHVEQLPVHPADLDSSRIERRTHIFEERASEAQLNQLYVNSMHNAASLATAKLAAARLAAPGLQVQIGSAAVNEYDNLSHSSQPGLEKDKRHSDAKLLSRVAGAVTSEYQCLESSSGSKASRL